MNSEALLIQEFAHFSGCRPQQQPNGCTKRLQIDCPSLANLLRTHGILDDVQVRLRTVEALFNGHKAKHERKISYEAFKHILEALAPSKFPCFENPTAALTEHIIAKRRAQLAAAQERTSSNNSPYGSTNVFERLSDERLFPTAYKRMHSEVSLASVSPTVSSKASISSVGGSTRAICSSVEDRLPAVYERLTDPMFYRKVHPERSAFCAGQV